MPGKGLKSGLAGALALAALSVVSACAVRPQGRAAKFARAPLQIYVPSKPAISSRFANRESLRKLMEETLREIPRKGESAVASERRLLDASNEIALIAEAVHLNPELSLDAEGFFLGCAKSPELMDVFRAECYRSLISVSKAHSDLTLSSARISPRIRKMARKL